MLSATLPIDQDTALLGATLAAGQSIEHMLDSDRRADLVAARGRIRVNSEVVIAIEALDDAEILVADLP